MGVPSHHQAMIPGGTTFVGFKDLSYTHELLRDMGLDPWRQKVKGWRCLLPWSWLDVRVDPSQYVALCEERALRRPMQ